VSDLLFFKANEFQGSQLRENLCKVAALSGFPSGAWQFLKASGLQGSVCSYIVQLSRAAAVAKLRPVELDNLGLKGSIRLFDSNVNAVPLTQQWALE
jgi:hypothetical protein